jgi:hypothetical protein
MRFFLFFCFLFLISCVGNNSENGIEIIEITDGVETDEELENEFIENSQANFIVADLNQDSIPDSMYIISPRLNDSDEASFSDCKGPCITKISFKGKFPGIFIDQSVGGEVQVLDDINENGFKELVFFPYWFQSCWSRMDIYSFSGKEWKRINSIDYNCCEDEFPNEFYKVERGLLRIITNGEKIEETYTAAGDTLKEFLGVEAKVYEVNIP